MQELAFYSHFEKKHLHDHIISSTGEEWAHKTSLTASLFIDVFVHTVYQARKANSHINVC
jgi:hypothetical protein